MDRYNVRTYRPRLSDLFKAAHTLNAGLLITEKNRDTPLELLQSLGFVEGFLRWQRTPTFLECLYCVGKNASAARYFIRSYA